MSSRNGLSAGQAHNLKRCRKLSMLVAVAGMDVCVIVRVEVVGFAAGCVETLAEPTFPVCNLSALQQHTHHHACLVALLGQPDQDLNEHVWPQPLTKVTYRGRRGDRGQNPIRSEHLHVIGGENEQRVLQNGY